MARATSTDFHVLMDAAGGIAHVLDDMTDSGAKAELVMKVLRAGAGQGKAGAFELKDQAAVMAKMVASAGKFEGDNTDNIIKLMALAQGARSGGGAWNAASAATSIGAFTSTFGKGARLKEFEKENVKVFADEGKTRVRAPEAIIADALDATKGSQPKLAAMFGSVMGMRSVNKMASIYSDAEVKNKGTGKESVLAWVKEMTSNVSMSKADVTDASNRRMSKMDAKMDSQGENFDKAVEDKILPALMKLVPEFEKLVPLIVDLNAKALPAFVDLIKTIGEYAAAHQGMIDSLAAHPVGTIMSYEIGKSMANAGLGELFRQLITKTMGNAGAAGLTVALATLAITTGMITIDKLSDDLSRGQSKSVNTSTSGYAAAMDAERQMKATGVVTGSTVAALTAKRDAMAAQVEDEKKNVNTTSWSEKLGWFMGGDSGLGRLMGGSGEESKEYQAAREAKLKQSQQALDELNKALAASATALRNHAAGLTPAAGGAGGGGPGAAGAPAAARSQSMTQRN